MRHLKVNIRCEEMYPPVAWSPTLSETDPDTVKIFQWYVNYFKKHQHVPNDSSAVDKAREQMSLMRLYLPLVDVDDVVDTAPVVESATFNFAQIVSRPEHVRAVYDKLSMQSTAAAEKGDADTGLVL